MIAEKLMLQWENYYIYVPETTDIYPLYDTDVILVANNWFIGNFKDTIQSLPSENYISLFMVEKWGKEYWKSCSDIKGLMKLRAYGLFDNPFEFTKPSHKLLTLYTLDKRCYENLEIYDPDTFEILFKVSTHGDHVWRVS